MSRLLLFLALATACGPKSAPVAAPANAEARAAAQQGALDPAWAGDWGSDESSAVWTVVLSAKGAPQVSGVDAGDGELFEISDVSGAGDTLRFTSRMPSTDWVLQQTWVLTGKDTCEMSLSGAATAEFTGSKR